MSAIAQLLLSVVACCLLCVLRAPAVQLPFRLRLP
jgi:hypothetical protein